MINTTSLKQIFRYGIIGFAHNFTGYFVFLLFTWLGVDPKLVVAVVYPIFAAISYIANKRWTFSHNGEYKRSVLYYVIAHLIGCGLNLFMLYYFVDILHYPHELVQALAVFVVAGFLFLIFRFVVFRHAGL